LRKYATQKLLICPPHLHNAAALPWEKLLFTFSAFKTLFSPAVCGWLRKSRFLVLRWGCRLGDVDSYCRCSMKSFSH